MRHQSTQILQSARKALVEELASAEKKLEKLRQQLEGIDMALAATGEGVPVSQRSRVDFTKADRALDAVVLYLFHHGEGQAIEDLSRALYKLGFSEKRKGSNIQASVNTHITKCEKSKKEPKLEIGPRGELRLTERGSYWARTRKRAFLKSHIVR
jgi:hypothetical protein